MIVELTPRSAELIAHEQSRHGAISPELLIEQALEEFAAAFPILATREDLTARLEVGWAESERGESFRADEAWTEIDRILKR